MASSGVERRFQPLGNTFVNLEFETPESPEMSIASRCQKRRSSSCHGAITSKDREKESSPVSLCSYWPRPHLEDKADTGTNTGQVQDPLERDLAHTGTDKQVEITPTCPQPRKSNERTCKTERQVEAREVTTMMIRNLPKISQLDFLNELNKSGLKDTYNFAYMPCSFHEGKGKGYAFVNFCNADLASRMQQSWNKATGFGKIMLPQALSVTAAVIQGFEANLKKWTDPRMSRIRNPNLRPFIAIRCENGTTRPLTERDSRDAWSHQEAVPTNTCGHEERVPICTDKKHAQILPPRNGQPFPSAQKGIEAIPQDFRNADMDHRSNFLMCTTSDGINGHPLQHRDVASTAPISYASQHQVGQQPQFTHTAPHEGDCSPLPLHPLPNLLTSFGFRQRFGIQEPVKDFKTDIATREQMKQTMALTAMVEAAQHVHMPLPPSFTLSHPPPPHCPLPAPEAPAPFLLNLCVGVPQAPQAQCEVRTQQCNSAAARLDFERPGLQFTEAPRRCWMEDDVVWSF